MGSLNPIEAWPRRLVSPALLSLLLGAGALAAPANAQIAFVRGEPQAAGAAPRAAQPQKLTLAYKAQVGQIRRLSSSGTMTVEMGANKASIEFKQVEKATVTAVSASGDITFENLVESSEAVFNGNKIPDDDKKTTDTFTIRPDGTLAGFKSDTEDKDEARLTARLFLSGQPLFAEKPVGVGDSWTREVKGDETLGTRDARGEYKLVALEEKNGLLCARIEMRYAETAGTNPVGVKGTVWVEPASGDKVASDLSASNLPLGSEEMLASGDVKESRDSGGLLPADVVAKAQAALKPETNGAAAATRPAGQPPAAGSAQPPKPEPKKEKTIDELVKDGFEKLPGVLTLYRKKEPTKDTIYAELREDQLEKLMLLQATASTGTAEQIVSGDPISDLVFQFTRSGDDRIYLSVPNFYFRAESGSPIAKAVRRSFSDSYLAAYKIEAKQPERKALLIDVSELFRGDLAQISAAFSGAPPIPGLGGASPGMAMDREKTFVSALKNFPENLVVTTQYAFARGSTRGVSSTALADPRGAAIQVTYNLLPLPTDNGYRPRLYDPRVGYFTTEYLPFDQDNKDDLTRHLILRWDLRKKDPAAALSEPVQPLVFWLDNAIPAEYRAAARDGLLVWNKAFEKVGFQNAIVVKQMPDTPDPKDASAPTDTADMRFNVLRWVVSPDNAYAVALFRANPLTGQILNASITVDAGIIRYTKAIDYQQEVAPAQAFLRTAMGPQEIARLAAQARVPLSPALAGYRSDPRHRCEIGEEMRQQAWFGYQALRLLETPPGVKISEKEFADQFIRELVAHEFGHILGLRHNFVATTQFSLAQLASPQVVGAGGIGASVMDYNPFNIAALRAKGVPFFSQTIGTYDFWAIEYGYTPVPSAKAPEEELPTLKQIARKSGQPGHAYLSDEAADAFDPRVTRFDLSADPLSYWETVLSTSKAMLPRLEKRVPREGESYWEFTKSFSLTMGQYSRAAAQISRYIGGQNLSRTHKGDIGEKPPLAPVPADQQKKALRLLNQHLFSPGALNIPDRYFTRLTVDPTGFNAPGEFPIGDQISNLQKAALRRIFSGTVLSRIVNNEFKQGGREDRALTLPYLFRSVGDSVWQEAARPQPIGTLRRQLQRTHLDLMADMALRGGVPEDARMLAWAQLRQLKPRLAAALNAPGLNEYTRIHLTDSLSKVNRTLDARVSIGGGGGGAPTNLLQLLLGGADGD